MTFFLLGQLCQREEAQLEDHVEVGVSAAGGSIFSAVISRYIRTLY